LADRLLSTYKQKIQGLELIPDGGGCFEVKAGDDLVYSKLATGQFPEHDEVLRELEKRL
jgi:selenoprotein W-related protein